MVTFADEYIDDVMLAIKHVWQSHQKDTGKDEAVLDTRISQLIAQALATVDKIKLLSSITAIKYMEDDLMKIEEETAELVRQKEQRRTEQPISFEVVMKYARYFLQHIDYLLLQQSDPLKQADFFSVIFDQTPTYAEIASVTNDVTGLTGINELFKLRKMPVSSLVRHKLRS